MELMSSPETLVDLSIPAVIFSPTETWLLTTRTGSRESIRIASRPARAAPPTMRSTARAVSAGRRRLGGEGGGDDPADPDLTLDVLLPSGAPLALPRAWSVWDISGCSVKG